MGKYNIKEGILYMDIYDYQFDEENNKIDVTTSCFWSTKDKEQYQEYEKLIHNYTYDNNLFELYAWCDISGYDYWVIKIKEANHVAIDVVLKKPAILYTQQEIDIIRQHIVFADDYFQNKLV